MTPLGRYVLETVVTLFAVAGLAALMLYVARRSGVGRPTGPLELAGRLPLDARRTLYLVRVADVVYVIVASENGLTKLGEMPRAALGDVDTDAARGKPPFAALLEKVMAGRGRGPVEPEPLPSRSADDERLP